MPELPETETIARDLNGAISGRRIEKVSVRKADVLREVSSRSMSRRLRHATILRSWRRAKLVVIDLDSQDRIVVQPRFTGALLIDDGSLTASELSYSTMRFDLDDGRALHYADDAVRPRRWQSSALRRRSPTRYGCADGCGSFRRVLGETRC